MVILQTVNALNDLRNHEAILVKSLQEWRRRYGGNAPASDVINDVLTFLHTVSVLTHVKNLEIFLRSASKSDEDDAAAMHSQVRK